MFVISLGKAFLGVNMSLCYCKCKKSSLYKEAIETLNSLQTNAQLLQQLKINKALGQENNIKNSKKYLIRSGVALDELDKRLSIIHVSGTKGKGSTCALCEAILYQHGYKTGFFSSPHMVSVRERIRINNEPINDSDFARYFWAVFGKLNAAKENEMDMPSYFKFLTVMALNVFLKEKVEVAIVEVGIGGEYDCTNIFSQPAVVGISSLGLDHTSLLGNTLEQIAWQKGGIMKPGALAFTSPQPPPAMQVLHSRAMERHCPLWEVPTLSNYNWQGRRVAVGLKGDVQMVNASLALQLSQAWINRKKIGTSSVGYLGPSKPFTIEKNVADALKNCRWPGRYQIITRKSFQGTVTYYLDGAHTTDSIHLCAKWFHQETINKDLRDNCIYSLVYNVTGDRDTTELLAPLVSCCFHAVYFCPNNLDADTNCHDLKNLMVTSTQQHDRCLSNKNTWQCLEKQNNVFAREVKTFSSVNETFNHIEKQTGRQHVLVTGSLHLVGTVLAYLDPQLKTFASHH